MADRHHLGLCKNVLWPLFHYIPLTLEHGAEGIMHLWEGCVRTLLGTCAPSGHSEVAVVCGRCGKAPEAARCSLYSCARATAETDHRRIARCTA